MANIGWGKCSIFTIPVDKLASFIGQNFKNGQLVGTGIEWAGAFGSRMQEASRAEVINHMKGAGWSEIVNPVEGSVSVETSQGDKKEAKIEGGQNEDVRYNANTYTASVQQRIYKGRTPAFVGNDGIVDGNYTVLIIPEDIEVPALLLPNTVVNVGDNFSTEKGGVQTYNFDALKLGDANQTVLGNIEKIGTQAGNYSATFQPITKGTNEVGYDGPASYNVSE